MSADTIDELPDSEEPKKPSGGGNLIQTIIVVLIICGINGGVLFYLVNGMGGETSEDPAEAVETEEAEELPEGHTVMHKYVFDPVTTNLHSPYKSRLIKLQFTAEGTDPQFEQKCEENLHKLKDATNGILQSLTLVDVQDPGVRITLKTRLVNSFEKVLQERLIKEIFITDMVIQ
jgi:flagellar basal body-associated protein FliL